MKRDTSYTVLNNKQIVTLVHILGRDLQVSPLLSEASVPAAEFVVPIGIPEVNHGC